MSPYRQPGKPGRWNRRRAVVFQARRVRDALAKAPLYLEVLVPILRDEARRRDPLAVYNIVDEINSPQVIIDVLTACIDELDAEATEESQVPF